MFPPWLPPCLNGYAYADHGVCLRKKAVTSGSLKVTGNGTVRYKLPISLPQ